MTARAQPQSCSRTAIWAWHVSEHALPNTPHQPYNVASAVIFAKLDGSAPLSWLVPR